MNTFTHVPPGFRFHPTDEELVDYYLRKKVLRRIDLDVIKDVDLYKIEPWDLQELCRIGTEEQSEWYFFSHKDKKYPTGTRTNRATAAGFWKATGRDKAIYSKHELIGMRKTLVFYKGRAPNGQKSDWIMHEYRLETDENGTPQEEGWVVCRVFKKRIATVRKMSDHESPYWYDDHQVSFMPELESPNHNSISNIPYHLPSSYSCKKEIDIQYQIPHDQFLQLPLLETPKLLQTPSCNSMLAYGLDINHGISGTLHSSPSFTHDEQQQHLHQPHEQTLHPFYVYNGNELVAADQVTDWRVLHKFVASQLSHEEATKETNYSSSSNAAAAAAAVFHDHSNFLALEPVPENASTSTSSCQIELWK